MGSGVDYIDLSLSGKDLMAPFPNPLLTRLWPGLFVWSVLYVSDYALTLTCARLYRAGVSNKIAFEGSFEINPYFQADIDLLKK